MREKNEKEQSEVQETMVFNNIEPAISLLSGPSGISRRDRSCATANIT